LAQAIWARGWRGGRGPGRALARAPRWMAKAAKKMRAPSTLHSKPVPKTTHVIFRWFKGLDQEIDEVRVVGSCEELGNWEPNQGIALEPDATRGACWASKSVPLPLGEKVEYKYIVCQKGTCANIRWEELEGNRMLVPTGLCHTVEDDDGRFRNRDPNEDKIRSLTVAITKKDTSKQNQCEGSLQEPTSPLRTSQKRLKALRENKHKEKHLTFKNDVVLAVFQHLPFCVERDESAMEDGGWRAVSTNIETNPFKGVLLLYQSQEDRPEDDQTYTVYFVGQPGVHVDNPEDKTNIAKVLERHNCIPVFIESEVAKQHQECCNLCLWPMMHCVKTEAQQFEEALWKGFVKLNRAYAEVIEGRSSANTLIWVHDFHLILVPRFLRLRCPELACSFFLHSSFPNLEVLRCAPFREDILQGLLSCRVVTFQIFEYARRFLDSCQFILPGTTYSVQQGGVMQVEHDCRSIVIRTDHVVLPYASLQKRLLDATVLDRANQIRKHLGDMIVFASIDGDEPFAGMALKLRAFHKFLSDCPQYQGKAVLRQHVFLNHKCEKKTKELLEVLEDMTENTNKDFSSFYAGGPSAVEVTTGEMTVDEQLAFLMATDVYLDTSINDGLNLYPFMFYCAKGAGQMAEGSKGVAIVSEFTGCSSVLAGVLKVNPWNSDAVMNAMHTAITMENKTRREAFASDHRYVETQMFSKWVESNLAELKHAIFNRGTISVAGLDAGNRWRHMSQGYQPLHFPSVLRDYSKSKVRAIFLDDEGTLAPDRRSLLRPTGGAGTFNLEGHSLDPHMKDLLHSLVADQNNIVVVISGRDPEFLDDWFRDVEGIGLCAEYGFYWVLPKKLQVKGAAAATAAGLLRERWECTKEISDQDKDWKTVVKDVLQLYVKRVQGSVVEDKGIAMVWNYREVGAQALARQIAVDLARFLDPSLPLGLMHGYPVMVVNGKGYVEVKRRDVNKGLAVERVLDRIDAHLGQPVDFALCIGDDRSDEDMFAAVNKLGESENLSETNSPIWWAPTTTFDRQYSPIYLGASSTFDRQLSQMSGSSTVFSRQVSTDFSDPSQLQRKQASTDFSDPSQLQRKQASTDFSDPSQLQRKGALLRSSPFSRQASVDLADQGNLLRKGSTLPIEDHDIDEVQWSKTPFYTVTVGRKPSKASYFVKDVDEVASLLNRLASQAIVTKFSKFASAPNFQELFHQSSRSNAKPMNSRNSSASDLPPVTES